MQNLKTLLKNRLKNSERIAVLGIGSELRGDDAAGLIVAHKLEDSLKKAKKGPQLKIFFADTAPENLTGEIKKFKPSHLVIVDSADTGNKTGKISLLKPQDIGGVSFCTHRLPLTVLINYLLMSMSCDIIIVGIQPKSVDFGSSVSGEVENSAQLLARTLLESV